MEKVIILKIKNPLQSGCSAPRVPKQENIRYSVNEVKQNWRRNKLYTTKSDVPSFSGHSMSCKLGKPARSLTGILSRRTLGTGNKKVNNIPFFHFSAHSHRIIRIQVDGWTADATYCIHKPLFSLS